MMMYCLAVGLAVAALALLDLYRFDVTAVVRECHARAFSADALKIRKSEHITSEIGDTVLRSRIRVKASRTGLVTRKSRD